MKMYQIRRSVLTLAHQLRRSAGLTFGQAQKKAWAVIRLKIEMKKSEAVEFSFIKISTGEIRRAVGTLHPSIVPATKGTSKAKPAAIVTYFDLERQAWRSFKAENLAA